MLELCRYLLKSYLCVLFLVEVGAAQVAPLITNINGRQITSLEGQWHAIVDPYEVGAFDYHGQPLTNHNRVLQELQA